MCCPLGCLGGLFGVGACEGCYVLLWWCGVCLVVCGSYGVGNFIVARCSVLVSHYTKCLFVIVFFLFFFGCGAWRWSWFFFFLFGDALIKVKLYGTTYVLFYRVIYKM